MKVISFASYPSSHPVHGGQRRVNAIGRCYGDHNVEFHSIPFFFSEHFPEANSEELKTALAPQIRHHIVAQGYAEDVDIAKGLPVEGPQVQYLIERLKDIGPDAVQFEQPWLFPMWKNLVAAHPEFDDIFVIYSSQNVEFELVPPRFSDSARTLEIDLTSKADLIIAVSAEDAKVLAQWTKPNTETVVAPNGCWSPDLDTPVARCFPENYAMLAGSAHPPNAQGFWDTFGMIPGCIPPGCKLAIVGGVNNLFYSDPRHTKFRGLKDQVIEHTGVVSEETLHQLLRHAAGICLPITAGGGTNLKTAEALVHLKPIVAMRKAFRGFEDYQTLSGVYIADTRSEFQQYIRDLFMGRLECNRTAEDVQGLTWPTCIEPIFASLNRLLLKGEVLQ
jgi:hypothetical protein